MVDVYRISAVTLIIKNMNRSCKFYSHIPGFKLVYGGLSNDPFTTFQIGKDKPLIYLNLELIKDGDTIIINNFNKEFGKRHLGRIIFHTKNVDELYSHFKSNKEISNAIIFENEPNDASWGERYFHIREPDGYQLSFAQPIKR
jgi:catechol 2,3-dioxygenase-like lactoylglutathione lyase family enzyme